MMDFKAHDKGNGFLRHGSMRRSVEVYPIIKPGTWISVRKTFWKRDLMHILG